MHGRHFEHVTDVAFAVVLGVAVWVVAVYQAGHVFENIIIAFDLLVDLLEHIGVVGADFDFNLGIRLTSGCGGGWRWRG
jgi:hypothetical protein